MSCQPVILYETANMYLNDKMEILLNGSTHAVLVGKAKDIFHAKRVMDKLELYPDNLRRMYQHYR